MGLPQPIWWSNPPPSAGVCGPLLSECPWPQPHQINVHVGELVQGHRDGIHGCSLLRLDLSKCTLPALPSPGVDISGAAGPDKPTGQHAPGGMFTWVSKAVYTVENQAAHGGRYQWSHHSAREVTPNLEATDQHVLGFQLGT